MQITSDDFGRLQGSEEEFFKFFKQYTETVFEEARLFPILSERRVSDVWACWCSDLKRVAEHEPKIPDELDHFKRAGHLSFWIRRMSPLVDAEDTRILYSFPETPEDVQRQNRFRDFLFAYGNEYLAFDLGLQFCLFYERALGSARAHELVPTENYLRVICHFLKFKTVSPHGLYLVYKSLFA